MKILHTSDWHLGRMLYSKKERHHEHQAFLEWLLNTIKEQQIDLLIIAGDIFDTATPSSSSQKMYYQFLMKVKTVGCKNVIVIGGNHDSPSFLNAPKDLLAALNISVIGNVTECMDEEIIIINDEQDQPQLIVCAVPFLRERDMSRFNEGENYADRSKRINENIKNHYVDIAKLAEKKRKYIGKQIPIIATGHLSVAGGERIDDDGVRETYIGNIEAVSSNIFSETFEYVALGHYHIPSHITEHIRYCGSPIPLGFGETKQKKCVYVIDFNQEKNIQTIEIPIFQQLESISGNQILIGEKLFELKNLHSSVWVELIYNGTEIFPNFAEWASEQVKNSNIEIVRLQNRSYLNHVLSTNETAQALHELNVIDVFDKLLDKEKIVEEEKIELLESYKEIVHNLKIEA